MSLMQRESLMSLISARCLFKALKPRYESEDEYKWVDMGIAAAK